MLRVLRRIVEREWTLPLRIGVNRGPVFAGEIGPHYRRTYTVMGDTVNLAARLMAAAAPAQILTTDGVLEPARSPFATEPLPPFMVKGKARPVQAYAVGGLQPVAAGDDNSLALVGRGSRARGVAHRSRRGAPRLGLGDRDARRSRHREVATGRGAARGTRPTWSSCASRACPYESANPYWAFREVLLQIMRIPSQSPSAIVETALRERVASTRARARRIGCRCSRPRCSSICPRPPRPQRSSRGSASNRSRRRAPRSSRAMLRAPTIVVIEDAHWMDEASTDILRQVERGVAGGPWLVCLTRNDDDTGLSRVERPTRAC